MNRTDRLLAIVLELQGKGKQRAEDLASTFEVSKRTIYRDIEALSEAGVPVAAAPGQGYKLVEGYFLPPLSFTAEEAIILILGGQVMQGSFDAQYQAAAESAGRKITGVLPDRLKDEVRYLLSSIRFVTPGGLPNATPTDRTLQSMRSAILDRHTVRFVYHTRHRKGESVSTGPEPRKVDPYGLIHVRGSWYMAGYDHERREKRTFKLDRIESFVVLKEMFTRPAEFKIEQGPQEDRNLIVKALFDAEAARWVRESPSFFTVAEEPIEGDLLITLKVRHERGCAVADGLGSPRART